MLSLQIYRDILSLLIETKLAADSEFADAILL